MKLGLYRAYFAAGSVFQSMLGPGIDGKFCPLLDRCFVSAFAHTSRHVTHSVAVLVLVTTGFTSVDCFPYTMSEHTWKPQYYL